METKMNEHEINEFLLSSELDELTEHLKTGDSLLDIINLREVQHSAVIAWMFDPREGHGQGDAILRDFLAHAAMAANRKGSQLARNSSSAKFFKAWTPSRIKTASLNACFILTEYADAGSRIDILIIDPVNKFFIVIENKAGAVLTDIQLERYREPCEKWSRERKRFAGYMCAFVGMDKSFEGDENQEESQDDLTESTIKVECQHWALINYSWLSAAAQRATLHINRGNAAARLIQSYCQQQTEWRSKSDERCESLAAQLWERYPVAVKKIASIGQKPGKAWIEQEIFEKTSTDDLYTYAVQNRDVLRALQQSEGLLSVKSYLISNGIPQQSIRTSEARIDLLLPVSSTHNKSRAIYLRARRLKNKSYVIRMRFDQGNMTDGPIAEGLREYFTRITSRTLNDPTRRSFTFTFKSVNSLQEVGKELLILLSKINTQPGPIYE